MSRPAAILLAAGESRRLGTAKQKLPYMGRTLLRRLAEELSAVAAPLVVALPEPGHELAQELDGLAPATVFPPSMETGMGTSLALAARALLARLEAEAVGLEGVLVALVDQPLADRRVFAALERAARAGSGWAASDYGDGAWGVPARFPASALLELAALSGDRGAKSLLEARRVAGELSLVAFPGGALDIDSEADYARLLELAGEDADGGDPSG